MSSIIHKRIQSTIPLLSDAPEGGEETLPQQSKKVGQLIKSISKLVKLVP